MDSFEFYEDGQLDQSSTSLDDFEICIRSISNNPPSRTYSRHKDSNNSTPSRPRASATTAAAASTSKHSDASTLVILESPSSSSSSPDEEICRTAASNGKGVVAMEVDETNDERGKTKRDGRVITIEDEQPRKIVDRADGKIPSAVDQKSLLSLYPRKMLNDTVIEYYMSHLLAKSMSSLRNRIHLFNTFFFNKLNSQYARRGSVASRSSSGIERWDKNVKLFEKDFIVLPICLCAHWVLVIICYPDKISDADDIVIISDSRSTKLKEASMLIFDSLGTRYMSKFTEPLRSYLTTRWKSERQDQRERKFTDRHLFKEYLAKVPKQKNHYDCGIYLLRYFENFLRAPEETVCAVKDMKDLREDWDFDPLNQRTYIRNLLSCEK